MKIALLIPPAGRSVDQPNSSVLNETGQLQQTTQSGTFSSLLKDAVKNTDNVQPPPLSNADDPIEPASSTVVDDHETGAALNSIVVAPCFPASDIHEVASPVADKAESVQTSTGCNPQGIESIPLLPQDLTVVTAHDDVTPGDAPMPADQPQARTASSTINALPQPILGHDQSSKTPAIKEDSGTKDEPAIRSVHGAPANLAPIPLKEPPGNSVLPGMPSLSSLTSDQRPSPVMESQGRKDLLPAGYMNGNVQSLDRSSTNTQGQGGQEATLLGQTLSARVIGGSGGGEQDPFGASAQGEEERRLFQSGTHGASEPVMRGNQSSPFNEQFTSTWQAQLSPQGAGTSAMTPTADHLKLTQALLGEDRSSQITVFPGTAHTVHMELPTHDFGPLSVRISVTDQMVHTQFTTDRSDFGQSLLTRQDQLQQSLTKSGLELGQFQVHVDHHRQQETPAESQSRRQGEAREDNHSRHQGEQQDQDQDKERQHARSTRALSVFA